MHMPPGSAMLSSRDVHPIPKNVMRLDNDVTDIDAHTESNALFHITDCKVVDAGLELHSGSNRLDRARKLRQEPVPSVLDNAAAVFGNCRGDSLRQERCQFGMRSLFVIVHEPRVASHVGSHYRRQSALDPDWPLLCHGTQSSSHDSGDCQGLAVAARRRHLREIHRYRRAAVCGTVMDGLGTGRSSPKPPLPRDIALSAAASAQFGPLVAVGTRRACGGAANQQTDSALGRLCRV